jgi:hypothetical protein
MKGNCYIKPEAIVSILTARNPLFLCIMCDEIEVNRDTLADVVGVSVSTLRAWTISGVFGESVRRVGSGTRGSYYLYNLEACYKLALEAKDKLI